MKRRTVHLLDCTPAGSAASWFREALAECGGFNFRASAPEEDRAALAGADGLIISGSPRDAFADDAWTRMVMDVATAGLGLGIPVLGVCYGHQLLGRLHGAEVARNPRGWEVGECLVQSTGEASPLGFVGSFRVLESHQDCVMAAPDGCRVLASNDHTRVQAAEWAPHVYGVQFHPEFTGDILRGVWKERRDKWRGRTPFDLDDKLDTAGDCPEGIAVLRRFLALLG